MKTITVGELIVKLQKAAALVGNDTPVDLETKGGWGTACDVTVSRHLTASQMITNPKAPEKVIVIWAADTF